jgi:glycosyltransferase involved in cell wall biosynthesis
VVSEMTPLVSEAQDDAALRDVERLSASLPLRVAGKALACWRARRRLQLGSPRGPHPDEVLLAGFVSVPRTCAALTFALRSGALESASGLVDQLLPRMTSLSASQAELATVPVIEALLMLGKREEALALALDYRALLAGSSAGVALLELLDQPQAAWLPDGRANWLGLSRRIAEGRLNAVGLARALALNPTQWLRSPEAHLLFFSALWVEQPQRALRFLNGFLDLQGVPSRVATREPRRSANFLDSVQAPPPGATRCGPLVSIIVAAHSASATLGYAIDSLLAQTYSSVEILVADDASDDETLDVMLQYRTQSRVRLFRSRRNQGAYNVRNALAQHARGHWITFHDADDYALPLRIERQVGSLRRAGVVGCVSNLLRVTPNGSVVFSKSHSAARLSRVSLMLRRDDFFDLGMFRPARVGADEELQALLCHRFGHAALRRIAAPLMLSLSSPLSATQGAGSEALQDGYRSASRRAYSELIFRAYSPSAVVSDHAIERRLRETGNYAEPAELVDVR